jgi:hypothetical protein
MATPLTYATLYLCDIAASLPRLVGPRRNCASSWSGLLGQHTGFFGLRGYAPNRVMHALRVLGLDGFLFVGLDGVFFVEWMVWRNGD